MSDLRFTREHKWLKQESDGSITIGITDYAQEELGDVVYVELPETGSTIEMDKDFSVIESVKTTSDISIPMNGTVFEVNARLDDEPELINTAPLDEGWLIRIEPEDTAVLDTLMDEDAYTEYVETLD